MDEQFEFTGPAHRRAVRERVMKILGVVCLLGGVVAILEGEAAMTVAAAALGIGWVIAAKLAA